MREARDATLSTPKLLLPSIQVNIRAGRLPPAEDNGVSYLRIPVRLRQARTSPEAQIGKSGTDPQSYTQKSPTPAKFVLISGFGTRDSGR
jgi:hypothetical protein